MSKRYKKILKTLEKKLVQLILRMLQNGRAEAEINLAVLNLIDTYNPYKKLAAEFQSDAQTIMKSAFKEAQEKFTWVKNLTQDSVDENALELFGTANNEFALLQGAIESRVVDAVKNGIQQDLTKRQIEDLIINAAGGGRYQASTIANTGLQGFSRQTSNQLAVEAGVKEFKYGGPPPERSFCKSHYGKTYTLEQLRAMDNGQGLPVPEYLGGYNCTHFLEPVIETADRQE